MAIPSPRSVVSDASTASLLSPVAVRGYNTYTLGSNTIWWDESNTYSMSQIAPTFGQVVSVNGNPTFKCGQATISPFDFGLLFSSFITIVGAYSEAGAAIVTEACETSNKDIFVVWFDKHAVIHSHSRSLVIPIKSTDVVSACHNSCPSVGNFMAKESYTFARAGGRFTLDTENGEELCTFVVPRHIQKAMPSIFGIEEPKAEQVPFSWDNDSPLGNLISNSITASSAEEIVSRYDAQAFQEEPTNLRPDLICTPTKQYENNKDILGTLCYTDKGNIVLGVNFRSSLFVYKEWFTGEPNSDIQVDKQPELGKFYNITEECKHIQRFANTVSVVPPNAVQLDIVKFEKIKESFFNMTLPRTSIHGALGRVVIPEDVLLEGMNSLIGENLYCLVPVGSIGGNVVCKNHEGYLHILHDTPNMLEKKYYDVTEVVK